MYVVDTGTDMHGLRC